MDLLRGSAVVLVVLLHAGLTVDGQTGWFDNALRPYRMPMLMFLSGLLLERSLAKGAGPYVLGKVRGVVWPWLLWSTVMVVLLSEGFQADPVGFLAVGTHMWFLGALAMSYTLALVLRRVPTGLVAVGMFLAADLLQYSFGALTTYLWYGAFFFVGAALKPWLDRWLAASWGWPAALTGIALAGAALQAPRGLHIEFGPDQAALSVIGILALIRLAAAVPRIAPVRLLEWIGKNSIVTYLAHSALLVPVGRVVAETGLASGPATIVNFAIVLTLSILLTLARPHTEWLYRLPLPDFAALPTPADLLRRHTPAEDRPRVPARV